MKIIVDIKNYTNFKYAPYMKRGIEVKAPANPNYVVGQVVVVERVGKLGEGKFEMAVVLGCIDEEFDGELRLDLCGTTAIEDIRPANIGDFGKSSIGCCDKLRKECEGFKVTYNWNTYQFTVEEPNF